MIFFWTLLGIAFGLSPIPRKREKSFYEVDFGELGTGTGVIDETLWPNVVQKRVQITKNACFAWNCQIFSWFKIHATYFLFRIIEMRIKYLKVITSGLVPETSIIFWNHRSLPYVAIKGTVSNGLKIPLKLYGIPYSEPPVADRRFRVPVMVNKWETHQNFTEYKSVCEHGTWPGENIYKSDFLIITQSNN